MSDKGVRGLVLFAAIILLIAGSILFFIFEKQDITKNKDSNHISYNVDDYIEITSLTFDGYNDVYNSVDISKINIKNLSTDLIKNFMDKEEEIIEYITRYYNQIKSNGIYSNVNTVTSTSEIQVNGTILSILYRVDFNLDDKIFITPNVNYVITYNIDLRANKILTNDDLLSKYSYSKSYIAEKLFLDDILIGNGQIVIDKDTNMSLTRKDIERKKNDYIEKIAVEFDNIIKMYINGSFLVMIYDKKDLKSLFFDNEFDTQIQERYLK